MSALACPFCGSPSVVVTSGCVSCVACGASGPQVEDRRSAIGRWNHRVEDAEATIRLEESPNQTGGLRMALYYGQALVVEVEYVPESFAATMRGALMLIGGMAKAEELEAG